MEIHHGFDWKGQGMIRLAHLILIILAVVAVAVADVFLKKASLEETLPRVIKSPWMIAAILLYLYQIIFVTYIFKVGWNLSIVGSLQTAFYALVVILAGLFYFRETVTPVQVTGIILAISGAILVNT
jgi:multidrug transporter EmrE-like cation transporter